MLTFARLLLTLLARHKSPYLGMDMLVRQIGGGEREGTRG